MRMDFKTYLTEAGKSVQQTSDQRTHSEHVNHLAFDGHDAVAEAHEGLSKLHNFLTGKQTNIPKSLTTKVDGAPAFHIIKGQDGRLGLATKGLFNKNPKIAWNHEDISTHYGHAPGLEAIMHDLYDHAHKVLPKNMRPGEIYKGDALFGGDRKPETRDGQVSFIPNLLRYKYPKGSNEADRIQKAKVGVAFHTHYDAKGRASPISDQQRDKFQSHPDVFNMDPRINVDPQNYTPDERAEYNTHMENARREYQKLDPGAYDAMGHHNMDMRSYANDVVRRGTNEPLTTAGYIEHLNQKHKKEIEKYKTQASVDKKMAAHSDKVNEIMRNKEHFDKIFKMHDHLQKAKNVLIGVLDKNNASHVELPNGQPTVHEGYVDESGRKYVQQGLGGFSQYNLSGAGRFQKPVKESLNEDIKLPGKSHVSFIGRTQPPHGGHLHAVQGTMDQADKIGATHTILLTHTHDKNNPLTPEQKLYYAQKSFPGANVQMTSPAAPSLLHHASQLHAQGIRNFTVVAGPERLASYDKLLNSYNGVKGPHGYYKFDSINLMPSGDRDPDAEGVEGASGTAMKEAAKNGDRETFHAMASPHLTPTDKDKMMKDVQAGLAKFAKPKKLAEETVSAGLMVRGLGDVSGNPAVQDDPLQQYIGANALAKDQQNGALMKMMKDSQLNLIGFKEFNPHTVSRVKSLPYYEQDPNGDMLLRDKIRNKGKDNNATKG